jgi:hypothetical protein
MLPGVSSCDGAIARLRGDLHRRREHASAPEAEAKIQEANAAAQAVQTNFQLATARAQLLFALGRP